MADQNIETPTGDLSVAGHAPTVIAGTGTVTLRLGRRITAEGASIAAAVGSADCTVNVTGVSGQFVDGKII